MVSPNVNNERIKHHYRRWLIEAKGYAQQTANTALWAIDAFEASTRRRDFARFAREQAINYKRSLFEAPNGRTGRPLALPTIRHRLSAVKSFFHWLAEQPGFRSKIRHSDAEYFTLNGNDNRIATANRKRPAPELRQIHGMLSNMPSSTPFERRDRALMACVLLTGMRVDAVISLPVRNLDPAARTVFQDARIVRTKRRKTFTTWFFPVGGEAEAIVVAWQREIRESHLFGFDDPLFPATQIGTREDGRFGPIGLARRPWTQTAPVRDIFRKACERAGLPYYNPHSLRDTLALLGERICQTPEELKAWSQNLGHERMLTTLTSYGAVPEHRQAAIFEGMRVTEKRKKSRGRRRE